jgi:(2Fe-2S) ferredoxin
MPNYRKHFFVCTHGSFCWYDGEPDALLEALKKRAAAAGLRDEVRINRAGCLNACGHGPTMVVYPDGVWYGSVQLSDVDELFDSHVLGDLPLERLRLAPETTKQTDHYPPEVQQYKRVERELDQLRLSSQSEIRARLAEQT